LIVNIANKYIADGTVFQTNWSMKNNFKMGIPKNVNESTIQNSSNNKIFYPKSKTKLNLDNKVKLIAVSWSSNINKGFAIYSWLDKNLDFEKYEMTFVGNSPVSFNNICHKESMNHDKLSTELRKNDIFINENLPKIIQNFVIKKKLNIHFYHISSINVLIKDRMDKYTLTKINAEKNLINNFTSIIRLPLIINFKSGKKGDLKIFYKYLNIKLLPLFPMIYPGNIYRPIEIEKFCSFFLELIKKKKKLQIYNLMGEEKKTLWDLFQFIAKSYRKKTLKINTLILNKILPNIKKPTDNKI
jgi:hypothetical protein